VLLALAFASLLVACGDDDDDEGGGGQASDTTVAEEEEGPPCEATVPGSQVTFGVFAPSAAIDPPNSSGALVGGTELINVYDTLMQWDRESGEYVPKVAQSLEPNDDFTEWTLKLRPGMQYADGTPFDAENVNKSLDRFFVQGVRNNASGYLSLIAERRVVDATTLVFTLKQPWATFGFALADEPGEIVNVNAIGADVAAFGAQPPAHAGIGPYTVERLVPNEELVLKAREDYWDGPVCIERLRFVFVPGSRATYDAFKAGDLDVASSARPT
jgi:peptide/nickel transport system substrate-binding protein